MEKMVEEKLQKLREALIEDLNNCEQRPQDDELGSQCKNRTKENIKVLGKGRLKKSVKNPLRVQPPPFSGKNSFWLKMINMS